MPGFSFLFLTLSLRFVSWNIGTFNGKGMEFCEKIRRRRIDICCLQEVRWKNQDEKFLGSLGRRFKL